MADQAISDEIRCPVNFDVENFFSTAPDDLNYSIKCDLARTEQLAAALLLSDLL